MKKIRITLFSGRAFLLGILLLVQSSVWADVAVIVHKSNMLDSIDASMLKSVYLGKLKSWPNGSPIMLVGNVPGSDVRAVFLKRVVKKSERKFDSYWSKKVFAGKGMPPKAMTEDAEVKQWVAKNKNAVGYIDASAVDRTVKVLLTVK